MLKINKNKGFTLIETIAILSIFGFVLLASYPKVNEVKAEQKTTNYKIEQLFINDKELVGEFNKCSNVYYNKKVSELYTSNVNYLDDFRAFFEYCSSKYIKKSENEADRNQRKDEIDKYRERIDEVLSEV